MLFSVGARGWFEWIDTDANPSDGLSRDGVSDHWTTQQRWRVLPAADPEWPSVSFHKEFALKTLGLVL
jgi:hypothetical protein